MKTIDEMNKYEKQDALDDAFRELDEAEASGDYIRVRELDEYIRLILDSNN